VETQSKYLVWFIFGAALRLSPALNPIHEAMHIFLVEFFGGQVVDLEWSRVFWINVPKNFTPIVIGGAYWLELFVYFVIIMLRQGKSPAFAGILLLVYVSGLISEDFTRVSDANLALYGIIGLVVLIKGIYTACEQTPEPNAVKTQSSLVH